MICLSICAATQKKAMQDIRKGIGSCDLLELRMDEIADGDLGDLMGYISKLIPVKPVLVTHRKTKAEMRRGNSRKAWPVQMDTKAAQRWEILQDAVRRGVAYVDVELEDNDDRIAALKDLIKKNGCRTKLVCSHHDFHKTPALKGLQSLYQACIEKSADVIKIVPFAHEMSDNIRIFQFLAWASRRDKEVVAFCMGEKGRLSRIAAPLFGSAFTFAALDEQSVAAPGQIGLKDMIMLRDIIVRKDL